MPDPITTGPTDPNPAPNAPPPFVPDADQSAPDLGTGAPPRPQIPIDQAGPQAAVQQAMQQAPPPRPPGTSGLAAPMTKGQIFRNILGDFLYSAGKGLAAAGHGPEANARGAGEAINALPERDVMRQQLAIQAQQASASKDYKEAQAAALTPSIHMTDASGNDVLVPPNQVGTAMNAGYKFKAAQIAADSKETVGAAHDATASAITGAKIASNEKIAGQKITANKQLSADKLSMMREVLQNTKNNQAARLELQRQGFGIRQQEFAQKQDALSPAAQKTLMETTPVHDQIRDLMEQFKATKDDNTPAKHLVDRAKYAAGISTQAGAAHDTIAQLELNRIVGAARVLKGGSRAIQALNIAMKHLPNVWVDSDKMIYGKLSNLDAALQQVEDASYTYGKKTGMVPPSGSGSTPKAGGPLSLKEAQSYLQQAGGDPNKARALAKKDGRTF